jgi:hypothetical protein
MVFDMSRTHREAEFFLRTFPLSSAESSGMDFVGPACDHSTYVFLYDFVASAWPFASLRLSCSRVHQKQNKKHLCSRAHVSKERQKNGAAGSLVFRQKNKRGHYVAGVQ